MRAGACARFEVIDYAGCGSICLCAKRALDRGASVDFGVQVLVTKAVLDKSSQSSGGPEGASYGEVAGQVARFGLDACLARIIRICKFAFTIETVGMLIRFVVDAVLRAIEHVVAAAAFCMVGTFAVLLEGGPARRERFAALPTS